jgi:hypothetical protein
MIKCTSKIRLIGLTQQGHKWEEQIHPKHYYWSYKTFLFNYFNCLNEIEKYLKLDRGENLGKHYSLVSTWVSWVSCQPPHTTTAKFKQINTLVTERWCKAHDKMHFKNKSEWVCTRGALLWKTKNKFKQNATTNDHTKPISF